MVNNYIFILIYYLKERETKHNKHDIRDKRREDKKNRAKGIETKSKLQI